MEYPPPQQPYLPQDYQTRVDNDQLNLLSTLFIVYGVLAFFLSLGGIFYATMMSAMFSQMPLFTTNGTGHAPGGGAQPMFPPAFANMFLMIGLFSAAISFAMGVLSLYASKCIKERRNWTWVMVAACVDCIHVPLGTALGVFTLIVVNRPSAKALFTS